MNLQIIIPVYNRFGYLAPLLDQLADQTLRPSRVVIVDHGTESLLLDDRWPFQVEILKRSSELWFTAATNAGLAHARLESPGFLVILNDDVVLGSNDWLARLVELAAEPDTIVASAALDEHERVLYGGVRLRAATFSYRIDDRGRDYASIDKSPRNCDVLPTRGIVFHTSVWDRVGPLDEVGLPHYASDYEWTARAKKQGVRLIMARNVFLITTKVPRFRCASLSFAAELTDFMRSKHKKGSLPVVYAFASRVFRQPYRSGFLSVHVLKCVLACMLRQLAWKARFCRSKAWRPRNVTN